MEIYFDMQQFEVVFGGSIKLFWVSISGTDGGLVKEFPQGTAIEEIQQAVGEFVNPPKPFEEQLDDYLGIPPALDFYMESDPVVAESLKAYGEAPIYKASDFA